MRKDINSVLLKLGISPSLNGFDYIATAIEILANTKMPMCKGIYEYVAKVYNTAPSRVERSIRHAITKIDKDIYEKEYGGRHFRNSDVIYTLALHFKEEQ